RAAAAGHHARRPDALHAGRRGRARLAGGHADHPGLGQEATPRFPELRLGHVGPRRRGPIPRARRAAVADAVASVRPAAPASFEIAVLPDADSLALAAADEFARSAADAVSRRGLFHVALSGGSTPRALYRRLTKPPHRGAIPWDSVRFFFGDERCVPPGDDRSNYRMAREALFNPLRIAPRRVFRVRGEADPARAAREYERLLRAHVPGRPPRLDLVLLGLGEDGHTASLFPGTPALTEGKRLAVENPGPRPGEPRITLTYRAIDSARR